jgi:hypothetical protein
VGLCRSRGSIAWAVRRDRRRREPTARPDLMVPFDELNRLMGLDELEAMDARYA